jgi:cytochrome P450
MGATWDSNSAWREVRDGEGDDVTAAYDVGCPVAWVEGVLGGFWTVLGHDELVAAAGDWVWLVFGAANVDPTAFDRPGKFDVDRSPNRHVGSGRGIHLCVGAPLARLQVRVVLEELFARTASFELAGPVRRTEWPRLGLTSLPLRCS